MSQRRIERALILALSVPLTVVAYLPLGAYLQWAVPGDCPPPFTCAWPSLSGAVLVAALALRHKRRTVPGRGWPMHVAAACLFTLSALLLVTTSLPPIGRRIGPWAELRALLVYKSEQAAQARAALGIPQGRYLDAGEMDAIERMVLEPPVRYTFPIIGRTVQVRLMRAGPPYVGVDFGGGRRAVFDLATMAVIYAD
jgi:hypothetical protein